MKLYYVFVVDVLVYLMLWVSNEIVCCKWFSVDWFDML